MLYAFFMALYYLAHIGFMVFIFALWIRLMFRYLRFSPVQPAYDVILAITNPLVRPMYAILQWKPKPGFRIEWPAVIALIALEAVKFILLPWLASMGIPSVLDYVLYIVFDLVVQPCRLLFWLIIIRMLSSWLKPDWNHPAATAIRVLSDPVLKLGRYLIPELSGYDISPFVTLVVLKMIDILLTYSLPAPLL